MATAMKFSFRESTGPLDTPLGADLRACEKRLSQGEVDGIEARWEFGKLLLARREGKQLPKGVLAAIVAELKVGRSEIQHRMEFAERFPTKAKVSAAADTYGSWRRIKREALPAKTSSSGAAKRAQPALTFRRWRSQLAEMDPTTLTAVDLRELDELEAAITLFRATPHQKAARS